MNRTLSIFIACIIAVCALADNKVTTPSTPKASQNEQVILRKRTDNKWLRMPSNNPTSQILGEYDEAGILYLYPSTNTGWNLIITTLNGADSYHISTLELQNGIQIGIMSEFYITLTTDSGETFVGEFYSE